MKKIFAIMMVIVMFTMMCTLTGCLGSTSSTLAKKTDNISQSSQMNYNNNTLGTEAKTTEENQRKLLKAQPPSKIDYSNERQNLDKRNLEWNNKNKLGYVYCISNAGVIIAFYTIKGKVSSVNSMLTTNMQLVEDPNTHWDTESSVTMESPNLDGSYGTNGDGIFFYTTEGVYVEWNGIYQLSSQPLKMSTKPLLTAQVKVK